MNMKLNRKGFTFVELLAVVVIIGILSGFAIVSVTKVLEKSHIEYAKKQAALITAAAREYYSDNKSKLPDVPLTTDKVSLNTLVDESYIDNVVDYKEKNYDYFQSFTTVKKMGEGKYIYYTKLIDRDGNVVANENPDNKNNKSDNIIINIDYDTTNTFRNSPINNKYYVNGQIDLKVKISSTEGLSSFKYYIKKQSSKYKESKYILIDNKDYYNVLSLSTENLSDGIYQLQIIAYDYNAKRNSKTSTNIVIDKTKPKCNLEVFDKSGSNKLTPNQDSWYNKHGNLKLTSSDNEEDLCLSVWEKAKNPDNYFDFGTEKNYKSKIDVKDSDHCGAHTILGAMRLLTNDTDLDGEYYRVKIQDNAGNIGICEKKVKIDTVKPKCELRADGVTEREISSNKLWYINHPQILFNDISDDNSGVDPTQTNLRYNNRIYTDVTKVYQNDDSSNSSGTQWDGQVRDYAGNYGNCDLIVRVDTHTPSISADYPYNGQYISSGKTDSNRFYYYDHHDVNIALTRDYSQNVGINRIDRNYCYDNYCNNCDIAQSFKDIKSDTLNFNSNMNTFIRYDITDNLNRVGSSNCINILIDNSSEEYGDDKDIVINPKIENRRYDFSYDTGTGIAFRCVVRKGKEKIEEGVIGSYTIESESSKYFEQDQFSNEQNFMLTHVPNNGIYEIKLKCTYGGKEKSTKKEYYCYTNNGKGNCLTYDNCKMCSSPCNDKYRDNNKKNEHWSVLPSGENGDSQRKKNGCICDFYNNPLEAHKEYNCEW